MAYYEITHDHLTDHLDTLILSQATEQLDGILQELRPSQSPEWDRAVNEFLGYFEDFKYAVLGHAMELVEKLEGSYKDSAVD